jgi:hypothetical protein
MKGESIRDNLLKFASELRVIQGIGDVGRVCDRIWRNHVPEKSVWILWNCYAMFTEPFRFPLVDLRKYRASDPGFYVDRLPCSFSELFLGELKERLSQTFSGHPNLTCICLKCGEVLGLTGDEDSQLLGAIVHKAECGLGVFFIVSGGDATKVFVIADHNVVRVLRPLYVGEYGDEDVGLKFGFPLILSEERRADVRKLMVTKSYEGITVSERERFGDLFA